MKKDIKIIAHRGASGHAPENTLASIDLAIKMGADMVEIDIRQTIDGVLVCLHDANLKRTTNGNGLIHTKRYKNIKKLDAGSWFHSSFKNESIPSLNEVLKLCKNRCKLLIEVKGDQITQNKLVRNLVYRIQKHQAHSWVIVQSFNPIIIKEVKKQDRNIETNQLIYFQYNKLPIFSARLPSIGFSFKRKMHSGVNTDFKKLTPKLIHNIKKQGKQAFCWTVNEEHEMKQMIDLGVDGIITNYPDRLKLVLDKFM